MVELKDVSYSRDSTVAAFRSYYRFLAHMYLDPTYIIEPPTGGWPHITTRSAVLNKSEEVIDLLRHLPYIRCTLNDIIDADGAPECRFADWQDIFQRAMDRRKVQHSTEDPDISEYVPKEVIGLTCGPRHNPRFLLDVKLGTIFWYECPGTVSDDPHQDVIEDDPYDYCETEEEAEWRAEGETWPVSSFLDELKENFRQLKFIPLNSRKVVAEWVVGPEGYNTMLSEVQGIYRRYGWPSLDQYKKEECLRAVKKLLKDKYPDFAP